LRLAHKILRDASAFYQGFGPAANRPRGAFAMVAANS
jgi:hypothetical protein